jgi:hypothetical protein
MRRRAVRVFERILSGKHVHSSKNGIQRLNGAGAGL